MLLTSDKQSLSIDLNLNPLHNNVGSSSREDSRFDFLYQRKPPIPQEPEQIVEVINRMNDENKKLTKMLIVMCDNYKALQIHVQQLMLQNKSGKEVSNTSKKRKAEADNLYSPNEFNCRENNCQDHAGSSNISKEVDVINISRAYVRTDPCDNSFVVKDEYTWRKYGQKVTRDNPSPRAYYKCSFAPGCPVKKKVQRSNEDASVLVAIYEGKHNHKNPRGEVSLVVTEGAVPTTLTTEELFSSDMTRESTLEEFLAEHIATSLTKNHSFTAALAAAISTKILEEEIVM